MEIKSQVEEYPTPPRAFMPQLPPALESAVMRALAKNPDDRFPNAVAFRNALAGIISIAPGGWEFQENFPRLAEPRVDRGAPTPLRAERSLPDATSAETVRPDRPSSVRKNSIKTYSSLSAFLVLLALAAVLVSMPHRPPSSADNQAKGLAPSSEQDNAAPASGSPAETAASSPAGQPVKSAQRVGVTAAIPSPTNTAGQALNPPEQSTVGTSPDLTITAATEQPASSEPAAPTAEENGEDAAESPIILTPSDSVASPTTAQKATGDKPEKNRQPEKSARPHSKKEAAPIKSTTKAKTTSVKTKASSKEKPSQSKAKRVVRGQSNAGWKIYD